MSRFRLVIALLCMALCEPDVAFSQQTVPGNSHDRRSVSTVTPIFSQLVKFNFPGIFNVAPAYEKTNNFAKFYIEEHVLPGETVDDWTQLLTITGTENVVVSHPDLTPKDYVLTMTNLFYKACPSSFLGKEIYEGNLNGLATFAVVASCGASPLKKGAESETALIIAIKGEKDFYTVQWAQRGKPSKTPINIDVDMWKKRMENLMPVKLCPIIPGEPAPYPSCANEKRSDRGASN